MKTLLEYFRYDGKFSRKPLTEEQLAEIENAKREGYMFDLPQPISHKETMARLAEALPKISRKTVADAFLYSLSTRRLEYRSALGSYYFAIAIPEHEFSPNGYNTCTVCGFGQWNTSYKCDGLNYINYCRYKYGGVRLALNEVLFDLEQFVKLPEVTPAPEDYEILKRILGCAKLLTGGNDKSPKLVKAVIHEKLIKTNQYEVDKLLNSLSICGIINNREYPSFEERFVGYEEMTCLQYSEADYPLNMWRARDGINKERLKEVFGIEL